MGSFVRNDGFGDTHGRCSTGIVGLDAVIGGGVERGTCVLLCEDENSWIHKVILQVFLSEGVLNEEKCIVVVKESVAAEVYEMGSGADSIRGGERMRIAWRYGDLSLDRPKFRFDLSKKRCFDGCVITGEDATFENILSVLKEGRGMRIMMSSLISPLWGRGWNEGEIARFLCILRKVVRKNEHVCMISVPEFLHTGVIFDLFFDCVLEIESHIFSGVCPNYGGILRMRKCSGYGRLRTGGFGSLRYGIRIRREDVCIEKIDIPPSVVSIGENGSSGCGGGELF